MVLPVHGRVDLLVDTLDSLAGQTWGDFELVVTDDSPAADDRQRVQTLVEDYRENTRRRASYHFTAPALGQAGNTNQGIEAASGELIRFLHSDDLLAPTSINRELEVFEEFGRDIGAVFHEPIFFSDEEPVWLNPALCLVEPAQYIRQALPHGTPMPSAMTIRRSLLDQVGLFDPALTFLLDWELCSRLLLHEREQGRDVAIFTAGLVAWRRHTAGYSTIAWRTHFFEHGRVTSALARRTSGDESLWRRGERTEFLALSTRYRWRRLREDLERLKADGLVASRRDMLACLVSADSLRQSPVLGSRLLAGLSRRARTWWLGLRGRRSRSLGEIDFPLNAGTTVDILPDVVLRHDPLLADQRVCLDYVRPRPSAAAIRMIKQAPLTRLWHPAAQGEPDLVLRVIGGNIRTGHELEVLSVSKTPKLPSQLAESQAGREFRVATVSDRRDGLTAVRLVRTSEVQSPNEVVH